MTPLSMVDQYVRPRGIHDSRVLEAMGKIPRHKFVPDVLKERAYSDHPLPIGHDQTISQPYIVAKMSQALELKGDEKVLEIGTGSGYQTAILSQLARSVFSIERIPSLAIEARKKLEMLSCHNVSIRTANGFFGWEEYAPYDAIVVTAAIKKEVPQALIQQLKEEKNLVIPISVSAQTQKLFCFRKLNGQLEEKFLDFCSFVPFIS